MPSLSNEGWTKRPIGYTATEEIRFFAENAKREDVFTLASGVQYKVLRKGCGKSPTLTSVVKNRYHMTLLSGKVIDSSYNRKEAPSFVLGSVIPGWSEAVSFMQVGAIWEIYIPSHLAYGSEGMGPVPKNSPLLFTVELIDFN
jgi:FKBP-type peptidyl-prolyl cis-trans isomerase